MDEPQAAEVRSEPFTRFREKSPEISGLPEHRYQEQEHEAAFFMDEPQAAEVRSEPFIRFREQEPSYRMPEVRAQEDGNLQKIALYSGRQLRLIRKMCGMLKEQNRYYS